MTVDTRPAPGTRITVNDRSVWPERIGCAGVVVAPPPGPPAYPWDGLGRHEVVVLLDHDPIATSMRAGLTHEDVWSCVIGLDALDTEQET